jgi:uncharacterized protein
MSTDKPSKNEEEYFARQDAELLMKEREIRAKAALAAERRSHVGRCPHCGATLERIELHGVQVERCPEDGGMWLEAGELEQLSKHHDPGLMGRVLGELFRSLKK